MLPLFIHVARLYKQQEQLCAVRSVACSSLSQSLSLSLSLLLHANLPLLCVCIFAHFSSFSVDSELQLDSMVQETDCDLATPATPVTTTLLRTSFCRLPLSHSQFLAFPPAVSCQKEIFFKLTFHIFMYV